MFFEFQKDFLTILWGDEILILPLDVLLHLVDKRLKFIFPLVSLVSESVLIDHSTLNFKQLVDIFLSSTVIV